MSFSTMRTWLAGGAIVMAVASAAYAQDDPRAMFEARYTQLRTALFAKDGAAASAILAADYESTDIRGETRTRAQVLERLGDMPPGLENAKPESKVLKVSVSGDSAAIESQMTLSVKRPGDDGTEMQLGITVVSDDTWVQRGGAWLLQKSVQKDLSVSKDGEIVFHQAN
jgi:Domain of unknown function (DUF4440)